MGMTQHEDIGRRGDLLAGKDFGFTEQIADEVERMDVEVEQGITLWIVASEIVEIVTDKMRLKDQSMPLPCKGRVVSYLARQILRNSLCVQAFDDNRTASN